MHILLPITDNCPSGISRRGKNGCGKYFMINFHKSHVVNLGFKLATLGSSVKCFLRKSPLLCNTNKGRAWDSKHLHWQFSIHFVIQNVQTIHKSSLLWLYRPWIYSILCWWIFKQTAFFKLSRNIQNAEIKQNWGEI